MQVNKPFRPLEMSQIKNCVIKFYYVDIYG